MKQVLKIFSLLLLLAFTAGKTSAQENRNDKFQKGVGLFISGNYDKAVEIWLEIYNTGYRSAELEYNIGNGYFKMKNIPGAILFYERAHLLKPSDEDINYNLQIARSLTVDRFIEIPEVFFVKWFRLTSLFLSTNAWAIISIIAFILCLVFLSVYLYSGRYKLKVLGFWLALFLIMVSALSFAFAESNRQQIHNSHEAVVFSPQLNGKSSPDESGTDLFVLHEGTKVKTVEKVGNWYEILLSDGNKGWVPDAGIRII